MYHGAVVLKMLSINFNRYLPAFPENACGKQARRAVAEYIRISDNQTIINQDATGFTWYESDLRKKNRAGTSTLGGSNNAPQAAKLRHHSAKMQRYSNGSNRDCRKRVEPTLECRVVAEVLHRQLNLDITEQNCTGIHMGLNGTAEKESNQRLNAGW